MEPADATWRPMTSGDLPAVVAMADAIHTLFERPAVLAEKFVLYPKGCLVLDRGGLPVGYGISHPWMLGSVPPLDAYLRALPQAADCLYTHDVALLPEARGQGHAARLITEIAALAAREAITTLALVSVYGTAPLWDRLGFAAVSDPTLDAALRSYGQTARYMTRALR
jgi:GNAT superfamily N-acetyltransferase